MSYCDPCNRYFGSEYALDQHIANSDQHNMCTAYDQDFTPYHGGAHYGVQSYMHYCQEHGRHFDGEQDLETHFENEHSYCGNCREVSPVKSHYYTIDTDKSGFTFSSSTLPTGSKNITSRDTTIASRADVTSEMSIA